MANYSATSGKDFINGAPLELNSLSDQTAVREIIFIDNTVPDYENLLKGVEPGSQVILLDHTQDGVQQITQALQGKKFAAIHIVSHGSPGSIQLGTAQLSSTTLETKYSSLLQQWRDSLTEEADILLYGCNVAAGSSGQAFVNQLSQITGADVAASTNLTGNTAKGGDWNLEFATNKIEAPLAFSEAARQSYSSVLADFPITESFQNATAPGWLLSLIHI